MNMAILKQIFLMRKVPIIILAVLFAIAIVLQTFILSFQQPKVEEFRSRWLKERADEAGGVSRKGRGIVYKTALADLQKFRERIYPKSHFAKFITELYEIASKNNLELNSISYKPTIEKGENLLKYELMISVSGNYLPLKRFINDLSRCKNPVVIDTVSLLNQGPTSGIVQLQVHITTYLKVEAL